MRPFFRCLPSGPETERSGGWKRFLQTPTTVAILNDDLTYRVIHMDGRELEADPRPSWMGYSVGRWVGDTLVVDSAGFNDKTWVSRYGVSHTEALRITERYRRRDFGHLEVEVTFTDPGAFAKPWGFAVTMVLAADTDMLEAVCERSSDDWTGSLSDAVDRAVSVPPGVLARAPPMDATRCSTGGGGTEPTRPQRLEPLTTRVGPAGRGVDPRLQHAGSASRRTRPGTATRPRRTNGPGQPLLSASTSGADRNERQSGRTRRRRSPGTAGRRPPRRRYAALHRGRRRLGTDPVETPLAGAGLAPRTAGQLRRDVQQRAQRRRGRSTTGRCRDRTARRLPHPGAGAQTTARAPGWPSTPSRRRISSARSMKCTHYYAAQHYVRMRHNIGRRAGRVREDSHPPTQ